MFSCARVAGWAAHILEQKRQGRLIRPTARYVGAGTAPGGLGQRRRAGLMEAASAARTKRLVLVAAILGTAVVTIDSTVVNVALPAIAEDLGGGLAGQQWTANAYLVTLGSLLLIGGSLGDIFGERRVFALGVLLFGVTSMVCALAPTIEVLIAGRALQGVAGALLTPAALAVIVATFPPDERGQARWAPGPPGAGSARCSGRSSAGSSWTRRPGAGSSPSTSRS